MGSAEKDLAVAATAPDLRSAAITRCGGAEGYAQCLIDCVPDATMRVACNAACDARATAEVERRFTDAVACGQNYCLGRMDMASGDCILVSGVFKEKDGTALSNANPLKDCLYCLNNSLAALFGDICFPASDPDCNPAQCQALVTACTNN